MGLFGKKKGGAAGHAPAPVAPVQPVVPASVSARPAHMPSTFNASAFKQSLKIGKTRAKVQQQKAQNTAFKTRQAVVEELRQNKNPTAYIKMEQYLRDTSQIEAFDIMEAYIELLISRVHLVASTSDFDGLSDDVKEAVASVVFASGRWSNAELAQATSQLSSQFSAGIVEPFRSSSGPNAHCINSLLAQKLEGASPDGYVILDGLVQIAAEEGLDWSPGSAEPEDLRRPAGSHFGGHGAVGGFGTGGTLNAYNVPGASVAPDYMAPPDNMPPGHPPPPPPGDDFPGFPPPPPPGMAPP